MISAKKLIKMAKKWQKAAAMGRKRILSPKTNYGDIVTDGCHRSSMANRGHFVIHTTDARRFEMPLAYLNKKIFQELFRMSEEEYGLSSDGPITLLCEAIFMKYVLALIQQGAAKDLERALLDSIAASHCSISASLHQGHTRQQLLACS